MGRAGRPGEVRLPRPQDADRDREGAASLIGAATRSTSPSCRSTTSKTFEMLARGDATGVFQLEGSGMRDMLRKLKPDRFEDLIALVALYRPGPMDEHPDLHQRQARRGGARLPASVARRDPEETYGIMVYQEQVMQIAQVLSRLYAGRRRPAAPRHGQEDPVGDGCPAQELRRGRRKNGVEEDKASIDLRPGRRSSRATASTSATPRPTRWSPTRRPISRPTIRSSSSPRR